MCLSITDFLRLFTSISQKGMSSVVYVGSIVCWGEISPDLPRPAPRPTQLPVKWAQTAFPLGKAAEAWR